MNKNVYIVMNNIIKVLKSKKIFLQSAKIKCVNILGAQRNNVGVSLY